MIPGSHLDRIDAALAPLGLVCAQGQRLAQGANNVVYAFEAGGRSWVAKIGVNPGSRQLHREWELLRAHPALGAACLAFTTDADGSQLLVQERLTGAHPSALDEAELEALGALVRGYHALTPPPETPREDWKGFVTARILKPPQKGALAPWAGDLEALRQAALIVGERLEATAPADRGTLVHGDLIGPNLLQQAPGRFRLIDWEGVRVDEAEADVATLWKGFRCGEADQLAFLRGYGPGLRPARLRFRRLLHDLQVAAWRLACQLPAVEGAAYDRALGETEQELDWARQALAAPWGNG